MDKNIWANRRVLVTGGNGFVGRHLLQSLATLGPKEIVVADIRQPSGSGFPGEFIAVDLCNRAQTLEFGRANTFDVVFNLAGKIDQSIRENIYHELFHIHAIATINLIDAVKIHGVDKFVHVGSAAEYGNAACPFDPCKTLDIPNSAYGASKLAATKTVIAQSISESFPGVVLRPFYIYGPGQPQNGFLCNALATARAGGKFATTDGRQTRDFVHIQKVVDDIIRVADDPHVIGKICNSCSGRETTLREVLLKLKELYSSFDPIFGAIPYRPTDQMSSVGVPTYPIDSQVAWNMLENFLRPT